MVVPNDALHGRIWLPQVPELNEAILAARDQAKGLVRIVVHVSHRETMRFRQRRSCSAAGETCWGGGGRWLFVI